MKRVGYFLVLLISFSGFAATDVYVSTSGSDSNPGTLSQPFATLEAARDALRSGGAATVWIRGGTYRRTSTLLLDNRDSGTIYRAYINESPVFSGAAALTNFAVLTNSATLARLKSVARGNVLVSDISYLGVSDYGSLSNRGAITQGGISATSAGSPTRPWMSELFFDTNRQQIARWPNQDSSGEVWAWTTLPTPGAYHMDSTDRWFTYRESNPSTWALTETVWVHGGWCFAWDDSYQQVTGIGASTNAILTDAPGDNGFVDGSPYEALNALEELDRPGEWVIHRSANLLYFWPPSSNANSRTTLSVLPTDMVALTNASNVKFLNLTLESGRASGVTMRNSTNVLIAGCEIRNFGNMGVVVGNSIYTNLAGSLPTGYDYQGGLSNQIVGCYLHNLGEGGIVLSGGDRTTLTPCYHAATNDYIHDYNTNIRNFRPAVHMEGVGITVSRCTIHDSPQEAIYFDGNDHLIEYCNIYRVCKDTDDSGAIYSYAEDWRQQGTIIRYNLIQQSQQNGIYLDAFTSGVTIYGNVILNELYPVLVNGGRNITTANNILVGYQYSPGWHLSNLGTTWATGSIPTMVASLETVPYTSSPYSKYGAMPQLHTDILAWESTPTFTTLTNLGFAKQNKIYTNMFLASEIHLYDMDQSALDLKTNFFYVAFTDCNSFTSSPTVLAVSSRSFGLSAGSPETIYGFVPFPKDLLGVTNDSYGLVTVPPIYPPLLSRTPFLGQAISLPGVLQVEDYDEGTNSSYNSEDRRYGNNSSGNGRYRIESPFYIWGVLTNGHREYSVDMTYPPVWAEYTVNVTYPGSYTAIASYKDFMDGAFHLSCNGVQINTNMTATNLASVVTLPAGTSILRLTSDTTGNSHPDYITFLFNGTTNVSSTATITTLNVGTLRTP